MICHLSLFDNKNMKKPSSYFFRFFDVYFVEKSNYASQQNQFIDQDYRYLSLINLNN